MTTSSTPTKLQSLIYESSVTSKDGKSSLQVLDQLLLPSETKYINVPDIQTAFRVIHDMNIRGKGAKSFFCDNVLVVRWFSSAEIKQNIKKNSN